jgi:hypothetical protein
MNGPDVYQPDPLAWRDLPRASVPWVESLRSDRFWVMLLDNVKASARVRDAVTKAVVWLEMKGLTDQAKELDEAVQAMREAVFGCRQAMAAYGPSKAKDVPEVQARREAWVASVGNLCSIAEQVVAAVPSETWEGLDG